MPENRCSFYTHNIHIFPDQPNFTVRPAVLPFKKEVYEVIEHEKISITCAASGIPEPKIAWFKGTQAISKSKFFKVIP